MNNDRDDRPTAGTGEAADASARSDGFSLRFSRGRGLLVLGEQTVAPGLTVDSVEMAIPSIAFPFDVSTGIAGLRNRRHQLLSLDISLSFDGVAERIAEKVARSAWISSFKMTFEPDGIALLVAHGPAGSEIPVSFRLIPEISGRDITVRVEEPRAYGPLPSPLLHAAVQIAAELFDVRPADTLHTIPDPVQYCLMRLLPVRGWRIPDTSDIVPGELEILPDVIRLRYRSPEVSRREDAVSIGQARDLAGLRHQEERRLCRDIDIAISSGDFDRARNLCLRQMERTPDSAAVLTRQTMMDILDPTLRATALSVLRESVTAPDSRSDTLAVLAHGAALDEDAHRETDVLELLLSHSNALETLGASLRAGRLTRAFAPTQSVAFLNRAMAARRDDTAVLLALMETHGAMKDAETLHRLIPRWIAAHDDPGARVQAHVRAGQILLHDLSDSEKALHHFERAALADPANVAAAWGLADCLAGIHNSPRDIERAVQAYDRLKARCETTGDHRGVARAAAAVGEVWLGHGQPDLAVPHFRDSLSHFWDSGVQLRLAQALTALGRVEEGVSRYEEALTRDRRADTEWGNHALTLARLYLSAVEDYAAADTWVREAARCPGCEAPAEALRVQLLEKQNRWHELTAALEQQLLSAPSIDTALKLARARMQAGEFGPAMATLEMVIEHHPGREDLLEAYIEAARAAGSATSLRNALLQRYELSGAPQKRGAIAAELGGLENTVFENPAEALRWLELANRDAPDLLEAIEATVQVMIRLGDPHRLDGAREKLAQQYLRAGLRDRAATVMFERSEYLIGNGQAEQAAALLRQALPDLDSSVKHAAMIRMGTLFLQNRQHVLARDMFVAARRDGPAEYRFAASLGEAEAALALGDCAAAWEAAVLAGSGPPELRGKAVRLIAGVAPGAAKVPEAVAMIARVAQNVPDSEAVTLFELAADLAENHLHDLPRALSLCEEALEIEPENDRVRYRIIHLLERAGNRADLAHALFRFASRDHSGISELQRAADFFSAEGRYADAVEALSLAHHIEPGVESARMLAGALRRAGQEDAFVSLLRTWAIEDTGLRDMLTDYLQESGHREELASFLSRVREDRPARERQRLLQLADLNLSLDRPAEGLSNLLQAADAAVPGEDNLPVLSRAMDTVFAEQLPDSAPEVISRIAPLVPPATLFRYHLQHAVLLQSLGRTADAAQILATVPRSPSDLPVLLETCRRVPSFAELLETIRDTARACGDWAVVDELFGLSIEHCRQDNHRQKLLLERAGLRRQHLSDPGGAISDILAAARIEKLPVSWAEQLAEMLEHAGRLDEALAIREQTMDRNEADPVRLTRAASLAEKLGKTDDEIRLLRAAAEIQPSPETVLRLLALLSPDRDGVEMDELLERVALHPEGWSDSQRKVIWNLKAERRFAALDYDGAATAWITALQRWGDDDGLWKKAVTALSTARRPDILVRAISAHLLLDIDDATRLADNLLLARICKDELGDEAGFRSALTAVLAVDPAHPEANTALAAHAFATGDMPALAVRTKMLASGSWRPDVALWMGVVAEHEGRTDEARERFRELMDRSPQTPGAADGFLRTVTDEDDDAAVLQAAQSVSRNRGAMKPAPQAARRVGMAFFRQGDMGNARAFLQSAVDVLEGDTESLSMLARIYERDGAHELQARTLSQLGQLLAGDERTDALVAAARIYLDRLKDYKRAYYWFSCAAETGSDEPDVLLGLADCGWKNRAWSVVSRSLERLRLVAPHMTIDPARMYHLAHALFETREWPCADILEMLDRVLPELTGTERNAAEELKARLVAQTGRR